MGGAGAFWGPDRRPRPKWGVSTVQRRSRAVPRPLPAHSRPSAARQGAAASEQVRQGRPPPVQRPRRRVERLLAPREADRCGDATRCLDCCTGCPRSHRRPPSTLRPSHAAHDRPTSLPSPCAPSSRGAARITAMRRPRSPPRGYSPGRERRRSPPPGRRLSPPRFVDVTLPRGRGGPPPGVQRWQRTGSGSGAGAPAHCLPQQRGAQRREGVP